MRADDPFHGRSRIGQLLPALVVVAMAVAVAATQATAHVERAAYWPDPRAEMGVTPPAGGQVPVVRPLSTALRKARPGDTRVVCDGRPPKRKRLSRRSFRRKAMRHPSIRRLRGSLAEARTTGVKLRPSEPYQEITADRARRVLRLNLRLLAHCRFRSIQDAVTASRNNDRVVIMPGVYVEPKSQSRPTNDPSCAHLKIRNDRGNAEGLPYAYHLECPNDQNLIAVMGRGLGPDSDPEEPNWDRHGIPNLGPCIRCNLQIEGSGITADDVVIDAGENQTQPRFPPNAEPCPQHFCRHPGIESHKDVAIRVDRADGFVLRNLTAQHAVEHTIYVLETDGYLLEDFKVFYAAEYGVLTFVSDHGVIQDCDAAGHGDAGIYPGAAPETGEETSEPSQRLNTEVRRCDMHHNALGYSGTSANAVHVHHNEFYDNATGFSTDVFTAAGHPGFPQDSDVIEHNNFYSNNFNPYVEGSDVDPTVPVPVGTGLWIPGGNNNTIRYNRFWDNWRRGAMLFSVPDAFVCGPANDNEQKGCDDTKVSTSHRNKHYGNVMGRDPSDNPDPNGTDFWWDEFAGNANNCWYDNIGSDGTTGGITSDPENLPSDCDTSIGTAGARESELLGCLGSIVIDSDTCPWFTTPPEPQP